MVCVAGIDPSLASTGLARITFASGRFLAETSAIPSKGGRADNLTSRYRRIRAIADAADEWARGCKLMAIEAPAIGARGGSILDRSALWWEITGRAIRAERGLTTASPKTVKLFATGSGNADKAAVAAAAAHMWPDAHIGSSDAADALILATIAAVRLGWPVPCEITKYRQRALDAMPPIEGNEL